MQDYIDRSMRYDEFKRLVDRLAGEGGTTGPEQSESHINYTKLNRQRMARLAKTVTLDPPVIDVVRKVQRPIIWLIILESWCGDGAQNAPVIEKIADESDKIETRYLLRDENLELIDQFLENGARSIPKLIALDRETLEVLGTWGSRPAALKKYYQELKAKGFEKGEIGELLQRWYNEDKGRSLQAEFSELIKQWDERKARSARA